jgi:hypothetical protein
MSTGFPTSLDTYTDAVTETVIPVAGWNNMQDAIEALEARVGVTDSVVVTSHDMRLATLEAVSKTLKVKIGAFSIPTITPVTVSGVGFTPIVVLLYARYQNGYCNSLGFDDGTTAFCQVTLEDHTVIGSTTESAYVWYAAGTYMTGHITTLGIDGFTFTPASYVGSVTYTLHYLALGFA